MMRPEGAAFLERAGEYARTEGRYEDLAPIRCTQLRSRKSSQIFRNRIGLYDVFRRLSRSELS